MAVTSEPAVAAIASRPTASARAVRHPGVVAGGLVLLLSLVL